MFGFPSILFSMRSLQYHKLTFAPIVAANITSRTERLTDDFLRDARLVKISFPIVGTLTRTIEVPAFAPKLDRIAR
jgi:hypothetical protein